GYFGVSFADADPRLAYLLSGILNSSLTAFQFALGGPTWGLERPTVEPHDLLSLRIPFLGEGDPTAIDAVIKAEKQAANAPANASSLSQLDDAVFELYALEPDEQTLARESVSRARYLIFENRSERIG
ncbi:SAM-dependent DNA methyltransferase, partial [Pandoraea nosoerga]